MNINRDEGDTMITTHTADIGPIIEATGRVLGPEIGQLISGAKPGDTLVVVNGNIRNTHVIIAAGDGLIATDGLGWINLSDVPTSVGLAAHRRYINITNTWAA